LGPSGTHLGAEHCPVVPGGAPHRRSAVRRSAAEPCSVRIEMPDEYLAATHE